MAMQDGPKSFLTNLPGFNPPAEMPAAPGQASTPPPSGEDTPDLRDRLAIDASIDMHQEDADSYGDGSAVGSPMCSLPEQAAPSASAAASADNVFASGVSSISKMAQSAIAAMAGIPPFSQWVVLDNAATNTRTVMLTAGSVVRNALQASQMVAMVPFECNKGYKICAALQMEARSMFMELLPSISDAAEKDMTITLTVSRGSQFSLGSSLPLPAHHPARPPHSTP
jgi:hypothetical protein